MTDHILLISGLAVRRVLVAYFKELRKGEITDLPVPIGTLYMLEPVSAQSKETRICTACNCLGQKPYGIEYKEFVWIQ